jgi:hypothetical protein
MHEQRKSLKQREQLKGYTNDQLQERRREKKRKGMDYDRFCKEEENEPVAPI